jgi:hypothetical protein
MTLKVPEYLRTRFRKQLAEESGADKAAMQYLYSHDYEGNFHPPSIPSGRSYLLRTNDQRDGEANQRPFGFLARPIRRKVGH